MIRVIIDMAIIDKYVDLIKLLENIFGKGAVPRSIGTRTNVVRFPKGKQGIDPTKREFDVERTAIENPELVQVIENAIADRMGDITRMNDQELLTYTANVRRLNNVKNPPKPPDADVIKFGSGEEIKGKGLEELIEKQGTKFSPTTDIGRLEASSKRLEKAGEDLKKAIDEQKPQSIIQATIDDFLGTEKILDDFNRTGYVRATVRQIMREDILAGKLKLPKELEDQVMQGLGEPIDIWRRVYGEGALEQIDSIADDLSKLRTEEQAAQMARSKFTFEPDVNRPPGSYTPEQDPSTIKNISKELDKKKTPNELIDEYNKNKERMSLTDDEGGTLIGFEEFNNLQKRNKEIEEALDFLNIKSIKPNEPEGKADGGRIGFEKGKRVLTEIDKLIEKLNKKLSKKESMESMNPKTGELKIVKNPIRRAEEPTGTTVMDPEPEIVDEKAITKTQQKIKVKKYGDDIIKAADEIFPNYDDPKIAADQIVDSYAQMKFGLEDQYGLSGKQRMDLYTQAYDYVMDYNRGAIGKTTGKSINISDEATAKAFTDFARENDPEGFAKVSKYVDRLNELSALRSGQEIFENYNLETYHYLTSGKILQLLNQLKNPYKVLDEEKDLVKMGFTNTNFEGVGLKNFDEINFKVDKKQLETYLEDLYNKKQVGEAQTELFNLQDSGREPNANGGFV